MNESFFETSKNTAYPHNLTITSLISPTGLIYTDTIHVLLFFIHLRDNNRIINNDIESRYYNDRQIHERLFRCIL